MPPERTMMEYPISVLERDSRLLREICSDVTNLRPQIIQHVKAEFLLVVQFTPESNVGVRVRAQPHNKGHRKPGCDLPELLHHSPFWILSCVYGACAHSMLRVPYASDASEN